MRLWQLSIVALVCGCALSASLVVVDAAAEHATMPPTMEASLDAGTGFDALDLSDIHYATDIPDAQWGPRDAATGDVDCPALYAVNYDFDAGAVVRGRVVMCTELTNAWDSGFRVCCRSQFVESTAGQDPTDPSWTVLCVDRSECRLGGRVR